MADLKAIRNLVRAFDDILKRPVAVALDQSIAPTIARDGRFKTQFETNTSNGSLDHDMRNEIEQHLFHFDGEPEQRPVYGHVGGTDHRGDADYYGSINAMLNDRVKPRSTFMFGDSLNNFPAIMDETSAHPIGPYSYRDAFKQGNRGRWNGNVPPVAEPTPRALKEHLGGEDWSDYIEAQIHGGVPWSDVDALVGKFAQYSPDNMRKMADQTGKPFFGFAGTSEPPDPKGSGASLFRDWNYLRAEPGRVAIDDVPAAEMRRLNYARGGHFARCYGGEVYG